MNGHFSSLELQLVSSSLSMKTDQEIADILEKPVDQVIELINQLTDGTAAERNERILENRRQAAQQAGRPKKQSQVSREEKMRKARLQEREHERQRQVNKMERDRVAKNRREEARKFTIKPVDLSGLISVRIDEKTTVFVKPGTNIEAVRRQYKKTSLKEKLKYS